MYNDGDFISYLDAKFSISGFASINTIDNTDIITSVDGVGTKIKLAQYFDDYATIGIDLVAMVVNDIVVHGGVPKLFLDYYGVNKLDLSLSKLIIHSIGVGCRLAGCELVGGETAVMPSIFHKNSLDLVGFGIGVVAPGERLPKDSIKAGDYIVGFPSSGVHSNGFTILNTLYPRKEYLIPTKIYTELIGIDMKGLAHITGGGFTNISRILPKGLSYELEQWEFPEIFNFIQTEAELTRKDMLNIFNCGYGMIGITDDADTEYDIIGRVVG